MSKLQGKDLKYSLSSIFFPLWITHSVGNIISYISLSTSKFPVGVKMTTHGALTSELPMKKKFKILPSVGKVMLTVFWDHKSMILLDFLEPEKIIINSDHHIMKLVKLKV